jgi:hypothetical protein
MRTLPATWRFNIAYWSITAPMLGFFALFWLVVEILDPVTRYLSDTSAWPLLERYVDRAVEWRRRRLQGLYDEIHLFDILKKDH